MLDIVERGHVRQHCLNVETGAAILHPPIVMPICEPTLVLAAEGAVERLPSS
jgi:hypothetical protein